MTDRTIIIDAKPDRSDFEVYDITELANPVLESETEYTILNRDINVLLVAAVPIDADGNLTEDDRDSFFMIRPNGRVTFVHPVFDADSGSHIAVARYGDDRSRIHFIISEQVIEGGGGGGLDEIFVGDAIGGTGEESDPLDVSADGIDTARLADSAVTNAKLADNSVDTDQIADDAITHEQMASGSIGTSQLVNSSVSSAKIQTNAITTAKIGSHAITSSEMVDNAIGTDQLADGAVGTAEIKDDAITLAKLAGGTAGTAIGFNSDGDPAEISTGLTSGTITFAAEDLTDGTEITHTFGKTPLAIIPSHLVGKTNSGGFTEDEIYPISPYEPFSSRVAFEDVDDDSFTIRSNITPVIYHYYANGSRALSAGGITNWADIVFTVIG